MKCNAMQCDEKNESRIVM